ncbi:MAG: glycosyltransferase family 2 protein [Paraglaciecola sp.]|nr:glycosyltransferase family 2 protein [Paraglaciecola sp.]
MIDAFFWISFFLFLYAYLGYPLLINILSFIKSRPIKKLDSVNLPDVTVILSVYNAEKMIVDRLNNLLDLEFPSAKLRVLVVSDGSTDKTVKLVEQLQNERIQCIAYQENRGKAYALSQALQLVDSEYTLFADVRQQFQRDTLKELLSFFHDPKVGAVTGNLIIADGKGTPGLYWKYEKNIRLAESRYQSLIGVTGAVYLAKTKLIPKFLPQGLLLDDMYIPLQIVLQGFQVKFCPTAIATDKASASLKEEFDRKVRTLAGNYQLLKCLPWTLNPAKNPLWFQLMSHKVLRLIIPYLLILMLISSAVSSDWLVRSAFFAQILCYLLAIISYFWLYRVKGKSNIVLTFCMLNLAALKASMVLSTTPQNLWKRR